MNLRVEAINSFNSVTRPTMRPTSRGLYGKADNDRVKDTSSSGGGGPENDAVLNLAKNANEPSRSAPGDLAPMQSNSISIAIGKLYDAADSYNIRQQIVLERRKEPEATDKLVDIVKNSTVQNLRVAAINALGRKNDPRTVRFSRTRRKTMIPHDVAYVRRRRRARRGDGQRFRTVDRGRVNSRRPRQFNFRHARVSAAMGARTSRRARTATTAFPAYNEGMRADPCIAGPVRVVIDRADKLPSVQTYVGPADSTLRA